MNTRTILLADDSVTIQKVVELTFMEEEIEVVAVGSGEEALNKLDEVEPDLVIADVHMPGPDGFEVCRRVKERDGGIPVLLLVGTFEPFNPEDVEACGADGFLKKPFDSQELIHQVEELIGPAVEPAPASVPGIEEEAREILPEVELEVEGPTAEVISSLEPPVLSEPAHEPLAAEPTMEAPEPAETAAPSGESVRLSDEDVERIARRVIELAGEKTLREVAWEVVPDLAEVVIKDRLRELESQVD